MMTRASLFLFCATALVISACSCEDCKSSTDVLVSSVLPTYTYENVSYSGQQSRLAQLGELSAYAKTGSTGSAVDSTRLSAMYANLPGADFSNEYPKDLRSKTIAFFQEDFETYFGNLARSSNSTSPATDSTAGITSSADGSKSYLVDAQGIEWAQVVEKGLMGATLYYQATTVYLGEEKMSADNNMVEPGEGTAMEHHWDEAFGYLGVAPDFPANTDGAVFWGDYSNDRDADLGTNTKLMDALLAGRAAITDARTYDNDDFLEDRDAAIEEVRAAWELVAAGTAIHYLNASLENAEDDALRLHTLSEAVAFIWALQFNEASRMPRTEVEQTLLELAGGETFGSMNLWDVDEARITAARARLASVYGLDEMAPEL